MGERSCVGDLLLIVDTVTALVGLTILGFSIYVYARYNEWSVVLSAAGSNVIYYGLGVGAGLFLIAIWGCVASQRRHKCMQAIYFFMVLVCLCASIAAAIVINQYGSQLGGLTSTTPSNISGVAADYNTILLNIYVACCYGCAGAQSCPNKNALMPQVIQKPCNTTDSLGASTICQPATYAANNLPGYFNVPEYPTASVDLALCTTFGDLTYKGNPLIGYNTPNSASTLGTCGGGSPQQWVQQSSSYTQTLYTPLYQAAAAFAGIQAFTFILALVLACCVRDEPK